MEKTFHEPAVTIRLPAPPFRYWSTRSRFFGPDLYDGRIAGLHGAWDADVYVYAYDESRLCVVRMS